MISVIICSNNPVLLAQVQNNIQRYIGIEYELLYYDNRQFNKGICSVYNELASKAKFPYLCFLHEDVLFQTHAWGNKILETFNSDSEIGLIGIAGCKYKSAYFSGWFSNNKKLDCANYIHQYETGIEAVHLSPEDNNLLQEVICIDGVFMCSKKEAWQASKFNEDLLKGFHFYDIDFSLKIAQSYKVVVSYEVQLKHITSGGDYSNNWVEIAIKYHQNSPIKLPYSKIYVDNKIADKNIIKAMLDFLKKYNISFSNKIKWVTLQKLYLFPQYYFPILKFLFYKPFKMEYIHKLFRTK